MKIADITQRKKYGAVFIAVSLFIFVTTTILTTHIIRLNQYLHEGCNLPESICPFSTSVPAESVVAYVIAAGLGVIGAYLFFITKPEAALTAEIRPAAKNLDVAEKKIFAMVSAQGAIFQSELTDKSGMSKVKVTRILDKLEAKGLVERRRRGMTNVVMMRNN